MFRPSTSGLIPKGPTLFTDFVRSHGRQNLAEFQSKLRGPFLVIRVERSTPLVYNLFEFLRLEQWDLILGRQDDCDVLINDSTLSRQHARLDYNGACWTIQDLGSRNGIYYKNDRVESARPILLNDEDKLVLGHRVLLFFFHVERFHLFCHDFLKKIDPPKQQDGIEAARARLRADPKQRRLTTATIKGKPNPRLIPDLMSDDEPPAGDPRPSS